MIIGHTKQKKYFNNLYKNNSLSHAYLFTGQEMIGKKLFAIKLFELINGQIPENHPDFVLISPNFKEEETKIYIEDVRKLKSFFRLKPHTGPYRVAVIDDGHRLTEEAANALLKILEEPPEFSVLILISYMPGLIPATILSRCERVRFATANKEEISSYMAGNKIKREDKEFLIKLAGGRIGLINRLMEGDGISEARKAVDDLRKLLSSGIYEKMNYAKTVHQKGNYQAGVDYWLNWVSAHVTTSPKNEKIVKELLALNQIISQPQYNHRLALENFLLNL
jgi:hypothetical protein